ncbi:MAG: hypothetical protein K9L59_18225 [Desulfobacterales bacterium]|nr:hypothetical protein [Desulfobacterales bacterium]
MNGNIWYLLGLTVLAVVYIGVRNYLSSRSLKASNRTDEELITTLAVVRRCSSFDVFKAAGEEWNFSEGKLHRDFQGYLKSGDIPRYVAAYVRNNVTEADLKYRDIIYPGSGGRPTSGAG